MNENAVIGMNCGLVEITKDFVYNKFTIANTEVIKKINFLEKTLIERHKNIASAIINVNTIVNADINTSPSIINSYLTDILDLLGTPIEQPDFNFNLEFFNSKHSSLDIVHLVCEEGTTTKFTGNVKNLKNSNSYMADDHIDSYLIKLVGIDNYFKLLVTLLYLNKFTK